MVFRVCDYVFMLNCLYPPICSVRLCVCSIECIHVRTVGQIQIQMRRIDELLSVACLFAWIIIGPSTFAWATEELQLFDKRACVCINVRKQNCLSDLSARPPLCSYKHWTDGVSDRERNSSSRDNDIIVGCGGTTSAAASHMYLANSGVANALERNLIVYPLRCLVCQQRFTKPLLCLFWHQPSPSSYNPPKCSHDPMDGWAENALRHSQHASWTYRYDYGRVYTLYIHVDKHCGWTERPDTLMFKHSRLARCNHRTPPQQLQYKDDDALCIIKVMFLKG